MRRKAAFLLGMLVVLPFVILPAWAGPLAMPLPQGARAVITSPEPFSALRGRVLISGTAVHPEFQRYELYYRLEPGENWVFIGDAHLQQVDDGLLGTWDTTSLADGTYSLRVRVVRLDGNYDEDVVRQVLVANAQPTETPTPEVSPTPTDTPTPLPPTPTVLVEQPVIPTSTPRPTSTPSPDEEGDALSGDAAGEGGGLSGLSQLTSQIDLQEIGDAFVLGAKYALFAFAGLAAYFILKYLLTWLWARIRG
jgi:hypothetical protein